MNWTVKILPYDDPVVQDMVERVQQEYVVRYGGRDSAVVDPAEFSAPNGLFLVGYLDGEPVATGGWRVHETPVEGEPAVEVKRMYVVPEARRRGLASLVLDELERTAAAAGHRWLVLNTGPEQPEAVALYLDRGYRAFPPFGAYKDAPRALFYATPLRQGGT